MTCINKIPRRFFIFYSWKHSCKKKKIDLFFHSWIALVFHICDTLHWSSLKKWLMVGIISGGRVRRNFLKPCSAYFSPSSLLSNTPMLRRALLILYIKYNFKPNELNAPFNIFNQLFTRFMQYMDLSQMFDHEIQLYLTSGFPNKFLVSWKTHMLVTKVIAANRG